MIESYYKVLFHKVSNEKEVMSSIDKYKLLVRIKKQYTEYKNIISDLNKFNINTKEI